MGNLRFHLLLTLLLGGLWFGQADAEERFGGIGAQVVPTVNGELVVLGVLPGSPAARGGLRPGDMIVEVDGFALKGSDFHQVVLGRLWGNAGSEVRLRFLRPGRLGSRELTLKRVELQPGREELPGVRFLPPGAKDELEKQQ